MDSSFLPTRWTRSRVFAVTGRYRTRSSSSWRLHWSRRGRSLARSKAASIQLRPAEIRDMLRYGEAYLPFADALERFTRGIRHTVFSRRAKVGRVASSAYRIAQGMNLLVDVSLPVPQAQSMKRAFGTRRRKPASEPAPVPPAGS